MTEVNVLIEGLASLLRLTRVLGLLELVIRVITIMRVIADMNAVI